jgi:hypothetical protein
MYERTFGTDWDEIQDREEAVNRAFALGVAAKLGETHPGELDRINDAVDTSYDQSFVELAYHEGREKAEAVDAEDDQELWDALVEGETDIDPDARPGTGFEADNSLPGIVSDFDVDPMPDDSIEPLKRPSFLDRESDQPADEEDVERTMFGRPREEVGDSGSERTNPPSPEQPSVTDDASESEGETDETEDTDGSEGDADG